MEKYILFAGRLDVTKGIRLLLEAWRSIDDYDLVVCGVGPEEDWCKKYINEYNLKNVHMMGRKEKKDLMPIMKNASAVIIPTQLYEGFPMTIAESLSNGVPVLGSNIGNVNSIIKEKVNGIHFQYDSAADIVRAVAELRTVDWKKVMVLPKEYTPDGNYEMLMDIYSKCMQTRRHRR